jgi:hypothetical protein
MGNAPHVLAERPLPRVAIVTMTMDPEDLGVWLRYHLEKLEFAHVYLRVENTPQLRDVLAPFGDRITATFVEHHNRNTYEAMQVRQLRHFTEALVDCRRRGIDFLLHIDDDELLMVSERYRTAPRFFGSLPATHDTFHFQNAEAVFPDPKPHCFATDKFIPCDRGPCLSYINGKAAARVSADVRVLGPHRMVGGRGLEVPKKDAMVLHFDSCNYDAWKRKFLNLSNIDQRTFDSIPFRFYKDSIVSLQQCRTCDERHLQFWRQHKVETYESSPYATIRWPQGPELR